jgi:hypothetical protein
MVTKYDILAIYSNDGFTVIGHKVCFDAQTLFASMITPEISSGKLRYGKLIFINTSDKYGILVNGANSYKCNLFTIHKND